MTTWIDVRRTVAVVLVCHAVIHLLGVMTAWRLSPFHDPPYSTVILNGTLEAGEAGQLLMGALWLAAALALVGSAIALWRNARHAVTTVAIALAISLATSLIALPAARFGVVIDATALAVMGIAAAAPGVDRLFHALIARRRHGAVASGT